MRQPVSLLAAFLILTPPLHGQSRQERVLRPEITPQLKLSVTRGLDYLIKKQTRSGDFDSEFPVAANALVGLAFLAGGFTQREGPAPYTEALRLGTTALLGRQNEQGYFDDGGRSRMYGHGFATLYLAELYGTSGSRGERIRNALKAAVRVIEQSQAPDGGWDYDPGPRFWSRSRQYEVSDTSITVCQTLALRAARNLGITVSATTIRSARGYIARAQNPDGGFRYRQQGIGKFFESSAFPRSAAGVCILYSLGDYNSKAIQAGFDYLERNYRFPWSNPFPYYGHYYCAQAMFQAGGTRWREYFPWISEALLDQQETDGSWTHKRQENATQAAAMALIILQLPYRFLPIHER